MKKTEPQIKTSSSGTSSTSSTGSGSSSVSSTSSTTISSSSVKRTAPSTSTSSATSSALARSKPLSSITSAPRSTTTSSSSAKHSTVPASLPSRSATSSTSSTSKPLTTGKSTATSTTKSTTSSSSSTTSKVSSSTRVPLSSRTTTTSSSVRTKLSTSSSSLNTTKTAKTASSTVSSVSQQKHAKVVSNVDSQNYEQFSPSSMKPINVDTNSLASSTSSEFSQDFERVVSEFIVLDEKQQQQVVISDSYESLPNETFFNDPSNPIVIGDDSDEDPHYESLDNDDYQQYEEDQEQDIEQSDIIKEEQEQEQEQEPVTEPEEEPIEKISTKKSGGIFSSFLNLLPKSFVQTKSSSSSSTTTTTTTTSATTTTLGTAVEYSSSNTVVNNQVNFESTKTNVVDTPPTSTFSLEATTTTQNTTLTSQYISNDQNNNNSNNNITNATPINNSIVYKQPPPPQQAQYQQNYRQSQHLVMGMNANGQPTHMYQQKSMTMMAHNNNPRENFSQMGHYHPMSQSSPNLTNYRQSQQFNPNMFMPHNQPNGVALLPFAVIPSKALSIFQDWYKSLWFAPTNFREQLEESLEINYYFVPYYNFNSVVSSVHKGSIGLVKSQHQQQVVVVGDKQMEHYNEDEIEWSNAMSNVYPQTYSDMLIYSPVDFSDAPRYEDIKEIQYWKLDVGEQFHQMHPQLSNPIYEPYYQPNNNVNYLPPIDQPQPAQQSPPTDPQLAKIPSVIQPMDMNAAWEYAEAKIKRNESYGNDQKLKKDHMAHIVADVETNTQIDSFTFRTIYAPVYKINYRFEGTPYSFIINGQNGNSHGQRPYGIGSIKSTAIKFLTAGLFENHNGAAKKAEKEITQNGLIKGSDLNEVDSLDYYKPDLYYLLLPASDQFLLIKSKGFIVLKNSGKADIVLEAHKRMSDQVGGNCILKPGETQTFAYKGVWCICVVAGQHSSLELLRAETNSGGDKPEGDLMMVSY